jgi:lysophospholipid acyltransferase (LPLAT)-like uncharacterized protein
MKIRHPALIGVAGLGIAWAVRLWVGGTVRYRCYSLDVLADPLLPGQTRRFLYSFWHETLLMPAWQYRRTPTDVLISDHADGEMIAQATRRLGMGVIRGSGTRGAVKAVRQILDQGGTRNVVFTPDGPRGPRRVVEPTMIRLAGRTGLPIVPVGFAFQRCKRLRSWDRFALPRPFTRAVGVIGRRIEVPADIDAAGVVALRERVQAAMDHVTAMAEELAGAEKADMPLAEVPREQRKAS